MFGEIALLNEEERSATVIAETQTTTIILSQEILFKMIEHDDNSINKEIIRRIEENVGDE
jgi:CRP-like cAMP-binding protein